MDHPLFRLFPALGSDLPRNGRPEARAARALYDRTIKAIEAAMTPPPWFHQLDEQQRTEWIRHAYGRTKNLRLAAHHLLLAGTESLGSPGSATAPAATDDAPQG